VLGCIITGELFHTYADASEGELSRLRASLVNQASLADLARSLKLGEYLLLGSGERKSGGSRRESILSDSLEAIFGAIYLDGGFAACQACIRDLFRGRIAGARRMRTLKDPKTQLQEYMQSRKLELPVYTVVELTGEAHNQSFVVQCDVEIDDVEPTRGSGRSRRRSEQEAAGQMLRQLLDRG
jgi:ribonuclease-3